METYQWVFKLMDLLLFLFVKIKRLAIICFFIRKYEWLSLGVKRTMYEEAKCTGKGVMPHVRPYKNT